MRNERLGLIMILASLLVIGVIATLLLNNQLSSREDRIRSQGTNLARLLGEIPWEQLANTDERQSPLQIMGESQGDPDFAYGVVVSADGQARRQVTEPGVIIPSDPLPQEPSGWLGERIIDQGDSRRPFIEFHAPLFSQGEFSGYIRLGYFKPSFGLSQQEISFVATLALPIFLLTPLFYFMLRMEVRPLRQVNQRVEQLLEEGGANRVELHASGELSEFIDRFTNYIEFSRSRIADLENEQRGLVTSTKLLSYRQSRVESVLKTIPDAIVVLDEAGAISYVNPKVSMMLGIDAEDLRGKTASEWCISPEILSYLSRFESGHLSGNVPDPIRFTPELNKSITVEMRAYPLFSPKNEADVLGTLVVLHDVSKEQQSDRSRGEFVAQVAHELKTPLNVLSLYSESLIGEDGGDEAFRVEAVNIIHDEVERLASLINNLLAITNFELGSSPLNKQRIRISEFLEDAFNNISQSGKGKCLQFTMDLPKEVNAINADKEMLRIAVNNLLTNAIKYNRPNGSVILALEEADKYIDIIVTDTGIGISPEDQKNIYEKFYRSDNEDVRAQPGHGLGLSLVQEIVLLHGGRLILDSAPGKGSRFTIRLNKSSGNMGFVA